MRGSTPRAVLRVTGIMASSRRTSRSLLVSKLTNHNYATKGVLLCSVLEVTSMDFEREKKGVQEGLFLVSKHRMAT